MFKKYLTFFKKILKNNKKCVVHKSQMIKKDKPIATSVRIPPHLMKGIEIIMEREHMDKTNFIIQAIEYWVKQDGMAVDTESLTSRLNKLEENVETITEILKKYETNIDNLHRIIENQSLTISKLVSEKSE